MIVFVLLTVVDLAKTYGWHHNIPPIVLSWIGAGAVYAILYWLFDRHIWKLPWLSNVLRVPNLSGHWRCVGKSIKPDKTSGDTWQAEVTVVQSWDRIRVRLKSDKSGSNSVSAALVFDDADGFRLMYNYLNEPRIGETDLKAHRGFCELTFSKDLTTADGEYFNGYGRYTFGTMHLTKEEA